MDPEKNKRVLFEALGCMGMQASMTDSASDMMRRILCKPPSAGVSAESPSNVAVSWDVWSKAERINLSNEMYVGDDLETELDERWQFVKRSLISKDMMPLPRGIAEANDEQLREWRLVLVDKDLQYYKRKDGEPRLKGNGLLESIQQACADENLREQTLKAKQAGVLASGNASGNDTSAKSQLLLDSVQQVDIPTMRRRLANFLTTCPFLSDPHVAASKLAFAVLPPDEIVTPHLSATHKRKAVEIWDSMIQPLSNKRHREESEAEAVQPMQTGPSQTNPAQPAAKEEQNEEEDSERKATTAK